MTGSSRSRQPQLTRPSSMSARGMNSTGVKLRGEHLKRPTLNSRSKDSQPSLTIRRLSRPEREERPLRILDFDVETVAAGFADPNWVPQKITCVAWSWIGEEKVHS